MWNLILLTLLSIILTNIRAQSAPCRQIRVSNGEAIHYTQNNACILGGATWDVYEIQLLTLSNEVISYTIDSASSTDISHGSGNLNDGSTSTYWMADPNTYCIDTPKEQWIILSYCLQQYPQLRIYQRDNDLFWVPSIIIEHSLSGAVWFGEGKFSINSNGWSKIETFTQSPTPFPTQFPTQFPTPFPTKIPTEFPTTFPTQYPTAFPTTFPTTFPTASPTEALTFPTEQCTWLLIADSVGYSHDAILATEASISLCYEMCCEDARCPGFDYMAENNTCWLGKLSSGEYVLDSPGFSFHKRFKDDNSSLEIDLTNGILKNSSVIVVLGPGDSNTGDPSDKTWKEVEIALSPALPDNGTIVLVVTPGSDNPDISLSTDHGTVIGGIVTINYADENGTQRGLTDIYPPLTMDFFTNIARCDSVECNWWDNRTGDWSTENCNTYLSTSNGIATTQCSCNHLTEFALLLREGDMCYKHSSFAYIVFSITYSIIGIYSMVVFLWLLTLRDSKNIVLMLQHGLTTLLCLTRVISSLVRTELITIEDRFSIAIITILPYMTMFWIFTLMIFQWRAIYRDPMSKVNPLQSIKGIFVIWNILVALLCVVFFAMFVLMDYTSTWAIIGSAVFAFLDVVIAISFLGYALLLSRMLMKSPKSGSTLNVNTSKHNALHSKLCCCCLNWKYISLSTRLRLYATCVSLSFIIEALCMILATLEETSNPFYQVTSSNFIFYTLVYHSFTCLSLVTVLLLYYTQVKKLYYKHTRKSSSNMRNPSYNATSISMTSVSSPPNPKKGMHHSSSQTYSTTGSSNGKGSSLWLSPSTSYGANDTDI